MPDPIQAAPAQSTPADNQAPAAAPTTANDALANLSETERHDWRMTGALPKPAANPDPKPAAATPDPKPAAAPTDEQRAVSKRQQQINDLHRTIAEQNAELARLKTPAPAAAPRSADHATPAKPASAPAAEKFPTYDKYLATNPDASLEEWMDARDDWRDGQRVATEQQRAAAVQRTEAQRSREATFSEQVSTRAQADPTFLTKISPEVLALRPFSDLQPGEEGGPLNAIAEELLDSPIAAELMEHFTAQPEELARLAALRDPRALVREFGKLEARLTPAAAAASDAPPTNTVTNAPAPGTFLGSRAAVPADAVESAIRTRDAGAYIREANARELQRARK